jgi:hypothetical protein
MKKYPIRFSTWHLREKPKKPITVDIDDLFADSLAIKKAREQMKKLKVHVADRVLVSGTHEEIPRMIGSKHYLFRAYTRIFGDKAAKRISEGKFEVIKIELDDITRGMGVGCLTDG